MKNNTILGFLRADSSFTINKQLVKAIGFCEAGLLSEIISKYFYFESVGKLIKEGYFYYTQDHMSKDFNLSIDQLRLVLKKILRLGLIEFKKFGTPCRIHYRLAPDFIEKLSHLIERQVPPLDPQPNDLIKTPKPPDTTEFNQFGENSPTRSVENTGLGGRKSPDYIYNNTKNNTNNKENDFFEKKNGQNDIPILDPNDLVFTSEQRYLDVIMKDDPTLSYIQAFKIIKEKVTPETYRRWSENIKEFRQKIDWEAMKEKYIPQYTHLHKTNY